MESLISIPWATSVIVKTRRGLLRRPSLSSSGSSLFSSSSLRSSVAVEGGIKSRSSKSWSRSIKRRSCTCLFGLGVPELVVIAGVAALVFGPKKLPEFGRTIGKTVNSFQQAAKEFETELKKEPDSVLDSPVEKRIPTDEGKEEIKASRTEESL